MHVLVTWKYKKNQIKNNWEKVFPIVSQWALSVSMETEFWSNLSQNLMQPFPYPNDASYKIWSILANWPQRYSSFIWLMTESQNSGRTRQIQYSPTFSKRGYNNVFILWIKLKTLKSFIFSFVFLYILHCPLTGIMCRWIVSYCHWTMVQSL